MPKKKVTPNFEENFQKLSNIVEEMEEGGLSLENSLKQFEKGVALTRECQQALDQTEQKLQILLQENGKTSLVDYQRDVDSND